MHPTPAIGIAESTGPKSLATRFAFAPVDIAPLVWFRVAFGGLMYVEVSRFFTNSWIVTQFVEPPFLFKYFGFGWVHPFSEAGLKCHFILLGILSLFILLELSMSEHIGFGPAYAIASAAVVGLIIHYASGVLGSRARAFGVGAGAAASPNLRCVSFRRNRQDQWRLASW